MLGMAWCVPCEGDRTRECGACGETLGHATDAGMREFVRVCIHVPIKSRHSARAANGGCC